MIDPKNRISTTLSAAEQDKLLKGLQGVQKLMPFLVSLNSEQRKELYRVGDKSRSFIRKANEAARGNPAALPRGFDEAEFKKDAELVDALYPVVMAARQLADSIEDTFALAASEAYAGALVVYRALRDNDVDGLFEEAVDDLSARFSRKTGRKAPTSPPAPSNDPSAAAQP